MTVAALSAHVKDAVKAKFLSACAGRITLKTAMLMLEELGGVSKDMARTVLDDMEVDTASLIDYIFGTEQGSKIESASMNVPEDEEHLAEVRALKEVPLLVMDNSLRESTVAALKGHTVQDKWKILEQVETCGFKHIILGALSGSHHRVDDVFAEQIRDSADFSSKYEGVFYAFTEVTDAVKDEMWDEAVPVPLQKMKEYKISNPIIEIDLASPGVDYGKFDPVERVRARLQWVVDNLGSPEKPPRICLNMRDFFPCMEKNPEIMEKFIRGMAALSAPLRPWAMNTEDPSGSYLPQTLARFIEKYREWWGPVSPDGIEGGGNMCIHLHKGFGLAEASVLAALVAGANGVWCGVAETGAAIGHACSAITMTNLARYGNPLPGYNVEALRDAAVEITKITTGDDPPPTTEIYGDRAIQWVFDFPGMGDDFLKNRWKFNLAGILKVRKETRVHTLATDPQLKQRLLEAFSQYTDYEWDDNVIANMTETMLADLRDNRKYSYQTPLEISALYVRSGGQLPEEIASAGSDCIAKRLEEAEKTGKAAYNPAIEAVRRQWNEQSRGDRHNSIDFRSFYDLFLARFVGCYSCEQATFAWYWFDTNHSQAIEWSEFSGWLVWCQQQYPDETQTADGLINKLFTHCMLPDMRRALMRKCHVCDKIAAVCDCLGEMHEDIRPFVF